MKGDGSVKTESIEKTLQAVENKRGRLTNHLERLRSKEETNSSLELRQAVESKLARLGEEKLKLWRALLIARDFDPKINDKREQLIGSSLAVLMEFKIQFERERQSTVPLGSKQTITQETPGKPAPRIDNKTKEVSRMKQFADKVKGEGLISKTKVDESSVFG